MSLSLNMPTRLGLIVPSSNTTMETELPEMFARRAQLTPDERFTFHSSRMRMQHVSAEALLQMDRDSNRCAVELADAQCDAMAYACLVAIMSQGPGAHIAAEDRLDEGRPRGGLQRTCPVERGGAGAWSCCAWGAADLDDHALCAGTVCRRYASTSRTPEWRWSTWSASVSPTTAPSDG